jgi:molecular chaperone Hsp33
MPGAPASIPAYLEGRAHALPPVTEMVHAGATPEAMLAEALGDLPVSVLERRPVRFACRCSYAKVMRVLAALGRAEVDRILRDEGEVKVQCRFCGEWYVLDAEQADTLFAPQA